VSLTLSRESGWEVLTNHLGSINHFVFSLPVFDQSLSTYCRRSMVICECLHQQAQGWSAPQYWAPATQPVICDNQVLWAYHYATSNSIDQEMSGVGVHQTSCGSGTRWTTHAIFISSILLSSSSSYPTTTTTTTTSTSTSHYSNHPNNNNSLRSPQQHQWLCLLPSSLIAMGSTIEVTFSFGHSDS
jgi:hypothetical protein